MKILHGCRAGGKTAYAIMESARTGFPILTQNKHTAEDLKLRAKEMGLEIPEPVYFPGKHCEKEKVLIADNFDSLFEEYVRREFGAAVALGTAGSPIKLLQPAWESEYTEREARGLFELSESDRHRVLLGKWNIGGSEYIEEKKD